jgi:hypothetical protein
LARGTAGEESNHPTGIERPEVSTIEFRNVGFKETRIIVDFEWISTGRVIVEPSDDVNTGAS